MSTLKPILSNALNPILRSIRGVVSRFFTNFDEVAQSYVQLGSQVLLGASDFSIDVDFATDSSRSLLSGFAANDVIDVNINGGLVRAFARVGGVLQDVLVGTTNVLDGKLHRASVTYTSGSVILWVDGVQEATGTWNLNGSQEISTIGLRPANNVYFLGIIANVKIIDNGTTVLDMPIDQNYTPTNNTVIDRASGNNGTFINVADGDSTFYQLINGQYVDAGGNVLEIAY